MIFPLSGGKGVQEPLLPRDTCTYEYAVSLTTKMLPTDHIGLVCWRLFIVPESLVRKDCGRIELKSGLDMSRCGEGFS